MEIVDTMTLWHDYSNINRSLLQPVWDIVRNNVENDFLRSPLFPIVLSIGFYFLLLIPFTLADLYGHQLPWIEKYKIQKDKKVTWQRIRPALACTMWNNLVFVLPAAVLQYFYQPPVPLPEEAPSLLEFCWHIFVGMLIFDAEYFLWHILHHRNAWLYKHVHSVHHQYYSPFSWVTQHMHAFELFSVGIFTNTTPYLLGCHCFTIWAFLLVSIWTSTEAHNGYDLPCSFKYLTFGWYGGAVRHDIHHQRPQTNFAPFFFHWDRIFGTELTQEDLRKTKKAL